MFGTRQQGIYRAQIITLKAAYPGRCDQAARIGIFPGALHDTAPARIARDVDHGSEGPVKAVSCCFYSRQTG